MRTNAQAELITAVDPFRTCFRRRPVLSRKPGIAIDIANAKGRGVAKSFIGKIEFLE